MINNKRIKIATGVILGVLVLVVCCVFTFVSLQNNNFLKVDNFGDYYYNIPEKTQNIIFSSLYDTVLENSPNRTPHSGAVIRNSEPYLYTYNSDYTGYYGEFIVDIPEIQQSYLVKFGFNEDSDAFMGGFASLVYCLSEDKMIYPDFNCKENFPFAAEDN